MSSNSKIPLYQSFNSCFNTSMSITNLTPTQLRQAADLQEKIAQLQTRLAAIEGGQAPSAVKSAPPAKRKMSAAHIAKIRAAQKARWAKVKAAKPAASKPAKKRGMSAAGRANIVAAAKARWAKVNAAKAKVVSVAPVVAPKPAKKKFTMSPEAKAKISAAAKARWAKVKAAKK